MAFLDYHFTIIQYTVMLQNRLFYILAFLLVLLSISCKEKIQQQKTNQQQNAISEEAKSYWYSGLAEITSFELTQQRYGEERKGKAVLIYVTEDFDMEQLVKADKQAKSNFPVLKLNATKKFNTGIYPYHIMQSTFLAIEDNLFPTKITASIQEWCGQSFMMLEQKDEFEIQINSYFQQIGNQHFKIDKVSSENALWNQLRLFPKQIDTTTKVMLPSFEYLRLFNQEVKAYAVDISQNEINDTLITQLSYPELKRKLNIYQEAKFPHSILSWEENINKNDSTYVTKAKKLKQIRIDYWNKNQEKHSFLRDSLQLEL